MTPFCVIEKYESIPCSALFTESKRSFACMCVMYFCLESNNLVNSCCFTSEQQDLHKAMQAKSLFIYLLCVRTSLFHYFNFLFYPFLPSLSRYFFSMLSLGVPIDNFIVYGGGIFPQCMSSEAEDQSDFSNYCVTHFH